MRCENEMICQYNCFIVMLICSLGEVMGVQLITETLYYRLQELG